ncbi:recombination mediator RecR [Desulfovibrio sp. OttesenSCG-928-G11]|nr:recombination mediator RecR [Desulfovibrio sp. OttesenSCG-928-G11]
MHKLPEPLQAVVDQMARLPGLGPKSALRCAMTFLKWPEAETRRLGRAIHDLRDKLHLCERCGALSDVNPCAVCADPSRNPESLCVVADWDSLLTMEAGAFYSGLYLILGGLLAPLDNVHPDSLDLNRLDARLAQGQVSEVILALGATVEAENTASFLSARLRARHPQIRLSRLAQGIPLGSEVRFMDRETLKQSLKYRQDL